MADGEVSLIADFESDSGIDSDDEEDEYEHYEKLVTTRLLVGLDLETLNHCLVCYSHGRALRNRGIKKRCVEFCPNGLRNGVSLAPRSGEI